MGSQVEPPWLPSPAAVYADAFRCNIKAFLAQYGRKVPLGLRRATAYIVELTSGQGTTLLHVYEEKLDEKDGAVCDQCRCMGEPSMPWERVTYSFVGAFSPPPTNSRGRSPAAGPSQGTTTHNSCSHRPMAYHDTRLTADGRCKVASENY